MFIPQVYSNHPAVTHILPFFPHPESNLMFSLFGLDETTTKDTDHSLFTLGTIDESSIRVLIVAIVAILLLTWGYIVYSKFRQLPLQRSSYLLISAGCIFFLGLWPLVLAFIAGADTRMTGYDRYVQTPQWTGEQSVFFFVIVTPVALLLVLLHFVSKRRSLQSSKSAG